MSRKATAVFFVILSVGIFFPLVSLAGDYSISQEQEGGAYNATVEYDGLVPCGKCLKVIDGGQSPIKGEIGKNIAQITKQQCGADGLNQQIYLNCQLCHFFIMLDDVLSFVLIKVIPPLAVLMLVIGGVMFYLGGAKPELLGRARKLIAGVVIGLFLIYGAYMIVGLFLRVLGAANVNPISNIFQNGVFSIDCPVKIPKP